MVSMIHEEKNFEHIRQIMTIQNYSETSLVKSIL